MIDSRLTEKNNQEEDFVDLLRDYIQNLETCRLNLIENKNKIRKRGLSGADDIEVVIGKTNIEIDKYEKIINKIKTKIMSYGAIKTLK